MWSLHLAGFDWAAFFLCPVLGRMLAWQSNCFNALGLFLRSQESPGLTRKILFESWLWFIGASIALLYVVVVSFVLLFHNGLFAPRPCPTSNEQCWWVRECWEWTIPTPSLNMWVTFLLFEYCYRVANWACARKRGVEERNVTIESSIAQFECKSSEHFVFVLIASFFFFLFFIFCILVV